MDKVTKADLMKKLRSKRSGKFQCHSCGTQLKVNDYFKNRNCTDCRKKRTSRMKKYRGNVTKPEKLNNINTRIGKSVCDVTFFNKKNVQSNVTKWLS